MTSWKLISTIQTPALLILWNAQSVVNSPSSLLNFAFASGSIFYFLIHACLCWPQFLVTDAFYTFSFCPSAQPCLRVTQGLRQKVKWRLCVPPVGRMPLALAWGHGEWRAELCSMSIPPVQLSQFSLLSYENIISFWSVLNTSSHMDGFNGSFLQEQCTALQGTWHLYQGRRAKFYCTL